MPGKRNNKSGKKNKNNSRRGTAVEMGRSLPLQTTTPSSKNILMTFASSGSLSESAAGSGASYFFRLNSVYDPDATGVGTTATGYSTWSALYLNYKVHKVTVRVQGTVSGLSAGSFANVVLAPVANQAVIPANKQTWKMIPGAKLRTVANNSVGGRNMFSFVANYDNAKVARLTKGQYSNDMDWSGLIGSNPARMNYVFVAVDGVYTSSVTVLAFNVQITYLVEWFNPVPMQ